MATTEDPALVTPNNNGGPSYYERMSDLWQYKAAEKLMDYGPATIFIVGVVFNLLSIGVLLRSRMRRKSLYVYLIGLAVADSICLCAGPLVAWIDRVSDSTLVQTIAWLCKCQSFLTYASSHFSSWVLVMVTIERVLVVTKPRWAEACCKRSRALAAMGLLLLAVTVLDGHLLWTMGLVERSAGGSSGNNTTDAYQVTLCWSTNHFVQDVWPWIDTCVYSLLPSTLMLIMNVAIIRAALAASKEKESKGQKKLTTLLLTISFVFILLTTPISFFTIYVSLADVSALTPEENANLTLANKLLLNMMYLNHAINFFLYCLTGKRFRRELCAMVTCKGPMEKDGTAAARTGSTAVSASSDSEAEKPDDNGVVMDPVK